MQIKEIQSLITAIPELKPNEKVTKTEKPNEKPSVKPNDNLSQSIWAKKVLLDTLDRLENNIQLDDSHPLDRGGAQPIETFEEALQELKLTKSKSFIDFLGPAQANIEPQSVLSLFVEA